MNSVIHGAPWRKRKGRVEVPDLLVPESHPRILVTGIGNVLMCDDGFGVRVAQRLLSEKLPKGVKVIDAGIDGIGLVEELLEGYDVLIIADIVKRGGEPGAIYIIEPEVPVGEAGLSWPKSVELLGCQYHVDPKKVLALAKRLRVLPEKVIIVGCEPKVYEKVRIGLSRPVSRAVRRAVEVITSLIHSSSQRSPPTVGSA